jgi:hypothetical protein
MVTPLAHGLQVIRYVVTRFTHGGAEWLYDRLCCARGQGKNLIKLDASNNWSCKLRPRN